jgi:hypothetical protein
VPTPGLSLVGFMDKQQAVNYLRAACVPADPADAALQAEWTAAQGRLGAAFANAGRPDIRPIPAAEQPYIQQLHQQQWVIAALAQYPGAVFRLVEIDPLLAHQLHVLTDHSAQYCGGLNAAPSVGDLLPICLPIAPAQENIRISQQGQCIILASESLNVRTLAHGWSPTENKVGIQFWIQFGIGLPLLHVVRCNGRCYLLNGLHRVVGSRRRGATHVPCLFRDVATHAEAGVKADGSTFQVALLESANPPTVGHFTQGRAYDVCIRELSRILYVSWSEHAVPKE